LLTVSASIATQSSGSFATFRSGAMLAPGGKECFVPVTPCASDDTVVTKLLEKHSRVRDREEGFD
jgi:hypothetical protein